MEPGITLGQSIVDVAEAGSDGQRAVGRRGGAARWGGALAVKSPLGVHLGGLPR